MFIKRSFQTVICTVFAILVSVSVTANTVSVSALTLAERFNQEQPADNIEYISEDDLSDYETVYEMYRQNGYCAAPSESEIILDSSALCGDKASVKILNEYNGKTQVIDWQENIETVSWSFSVSKSGLYMIDINYMSGEGSTNIVRQIELDGKVPFSECERINFLRQWKKSGEIQKNSYGDEPSPSVVQEFQWQTVAVSDPDGMYDEPFTFYLTEGTHTLTMRYKNAPLYIHNIVFRPSETVLDYQEVLTDYRNNGYEKMLTVSGRLEAENTKYTNFSSMRMTSDDDPSVYPLSRGTVKMNSVGGESWAQGNSTITWEFDVEKSGLYKLNFRCKNNYDNGIPSYRSIAIDGKVPFKEWESYAFAYSNRWRSEVLADSNGDPYAVYLEQGRHTLTMSVRVGKLAEVVRILQKDVKVLSSLSLQIVMITGQNPDPNYDYKIEEKIPTLVSEIEGLIKNLDKSAEIIAEVSGEKSSIYQQLKQIKAELETLIEDTYYIPSKISDITSIVSEYGDYTSSIQEFPLALDYIEWLGMEDDVHDHKSSFFGKIHTMFVQFINSFTRDYQSAGGINISNVEITDTLDVWIGRGKDWGELVKRLSDQQFTPNTGIDINIHIVPAGQLNSGSANALLLAVSSGKGPDVALAVNTASVAEFAMRNAVKDLSQYSGFESVKDRFWDELFVPVTYKGGVYALPETVNFKVLIYRKDILKKLRISIPKTWEELYTNVMPVLSQNNMQFYYPSELDVMLFQHNGDYYNDALTESALGTAKAYNAFEELCNLYNIYGVPIQADFFNRFRTGEMPIGVGDFTAYIKILSAAPELYGSWGIAPVPGHVDEDGNINHSQGKASAESVMIINNSTKPEKAWEFIKWWTSDEAQTAFGNEIESLVGSAARWNTANKKAFDSLPWATADLSVIKEALSQINEVPAVLGGYFTTRHIGNAFNRCVVSQMDIRESLEKAVKDINTELLRKRSSS